MPLSANPAARSALAYITIGALMDVWSAIWYWYMRSMQDGNRDGSWWYICMGLLLSGAVLIIIGLLIGRIGREARHADAPPATPADAQMTANARMANANAAMAANTQASAPSAGMPVYVAPTPMNPAMAGVPVAANGGLAPGAVPAVPPVAPKV